MQTFSIFVVFASISLVASAVTAGRLWTSGLWRRYPVLMGLMMFTVPYRIAPMVLNLRSPTYFHWWIYSEPVHWMFEILVVRELCSVMLEHYKGICSLGRWMMYGSLGVSCVISILSLLPHYHSTLSQRSRILFLWTAGSRGLHLALAVFLILLVCLLSRYPIRLNRNVVLNVTVFTVFFLSNTMSATLRAIFDRKLGLTADTLLTGIACLCSVAWAFYLTPAGEEVSGQILEYSPEYERRVLGQLELLNRALLDTPI